MCGITGFVATETSRIEYGEILERMARTMAHRGPDDQGVWYDEAAGVGLAHRRLAIIDLSADGHQPMISPSGRYVMAYNGEVYNFARLRHDLENRQIHWRGHSDTEVMLAAMDSWGIETSVKQFIGMFAFAVWDRKERTLILCRDRLGIKPLYYGRYRNGFLFGSELKPLIAHPDFRPCVDRNALTLFFRHNYIPAPYSIYRDVRKLMPGTLLRLPHEVLRGDKEIPLPEPYWSAGDIAEAGQRRPLSISDAEAVQRLDELLKDAVGRRMISDVPIGAFLSGGIDSSTVVALMQAQSSRKVRTFSIGFREEGYDEARHAREVAAHLGTDHTELYVTAEDALGVIPELPRLYDEPFADSSQVPTYLLSKLTREHVTVSLSGDGGDELFGGYNRYFWGRNIWKTAGRLPRRIRKGAAGMLQRISPLSWDAFLQPIIRRLPGRFKLDMPGDRVHKLAAVLASNDPEDMYQLLLSHWNHPERMVVDGKEPPTGITQKERHPFLGEFTHTMMYLDLVNYLPDDILTKVDRASMGVALEARVPMIDHRVVEFAWRLPLSMKIREGRGKWILRKVLDGYVPRDLVERPKTGFGIPIDSWLRKELREWAEDLLAEKCLGEEGFLHPGPIRQKWREHLSGQRNWQYHLWDVLMFQAWKKQHPI
ncbi:MAG: asparagine synthase (glutamine-hydrolyzing) [Thermodesulfobacteriota bacterium]